LIFPIISQNLKRQFFFKKNAACNIHFALWPTKKDNYKHNFLLKNMKNNVFVKHHVRGHSANNDKRCLPSVTDVVLSYDDDAFNFPSAVVAGARVLLIRGHTTNNDKRCLPSVADVVLSDG
jgi:hypothetical protein